MANRQTVKYDEAQDQVKGNVPAQSYFSHLIDIILINLNERDSINYYNSIMQDQANAYKYGSTVKQLRGINDSSAKTELENAKASINTSTTVSGNTKFTRLTANDCNVIIKHTENLLNTISNTTKQITQIDCTYYKDTIIVPVTETNIGETSSDIVFEEVIDTDTDTGTTSYYFTVPVGIRIIKVTSKITGDTTPFTFNRIEYDDEGNAVTKSVWFDSSKDTISYIYVDQNVQYEFRLVSGTGKSVTGSGVTVTYASALNFGNIPTVYDSTLEGVSEPLTEGSFTYTIGSDGTLQPNITVPNNILAYQISYDGSKVQITSGSGNDTEVWYDYSTEYVTKYNPAITAVTGGTYTLRITGEAGKVVTFKYSQTINFTKNQFYGPMLENGESVRLCNQTNLKCANMEKLVGYKDTSTGATDIYLCTSTKRKVETTVPASTRKSIPRVNANEIVYADTWTAVSTYLRSISSALDTLYKGKFNSSGGCAVTCMTKCQAQCQLACQGCNGWTCHDQNCGGWS